MPLSVFVRRVTLACTFLILIVTLGIRARAQAVVGGPRLPGLLGELAAIAARPGEPRMVSAAGVTRLDTSLLTIENAATFGSGEQRRLVVVGGLNGDERGGQAILGALAWFKTAAPQSLRRAWTVSAMPSADPHQHARTRPYSFPPSGGFFDDPVQPESRYAWRWASFQAPDLVLEVWGGDSMSWHASDLPGLHAADLPRGSLAAAMAAGTGSGGGAVPAIMVTARASDGPQLLQHVLKAAAGLPRSALHSDIIARTARSPLEIAGVLARRYPAEAVVSYIPSVAWTSTLHLAAITGDASLQQRVRQQTQPWVSGERPLFGKQITLAAAAGTMVYAELAATGDESARALAIQGAEAVSAEGPNGIARHGQGWPEDMFMTAAVLARTGKMPGREQDLDLLANRLIAYAARLQRDDGVFIHFTDGRQPWGRGNGFAAFGLMEGLTAVPTTHPLRGRILAIYQRQMKGLVPLQAPDGMWRQIVDQPGSYREESVTAMVLSAMARGIRHGWLDLSFRPVVERAWRALAAHVMTDGSIVDVCTGTGAGPTQRFYLDRPAVFGPDDRGGAMALFAALEVYELRAVTVDSATSMNAWIIAVGSEMLTPFRVDTNSLVITERLNAIGCDVRLKVVVGDSVDELARVLTSALESVDVVVCTGGLGPTEDDITRDALTRVLGMPLEIDETIVEHIRARFARRGITMPDINRRQAMVPRGATVLANPNGTAPGLWIERGSVRIVVLPGPPREMKPMFDAVIQERLAPLGSGRGLFRRVLKITGRSESDVDARAQPIYSRWPTQSVPVTTTILAVLGQIELHLTAAADSREEADVALDAAVRELQDAFGSSMYSVDGRPLQRVVGDMLRSAHWTVAVGESCTGGLLASLLTDVPGSSDYVERGAVCYTNRAKVEWLGVPESLIAEHGAVSEPVAQSMAEGVRARAQTDVGIGVTGIAGPGGGTPEKPVGTVAIAVVAGDDTRVRTFQFIGEREQVKYQSTQAAMNMLRLMMLEGAKEP